MGRYFRHLIEAKWTEGKFVCVGLDSEWMKLPRAAMKNGTAECIAEFNRRIIDSTRDIACAFKLNLAFYQERGIEGLIALAKSIAYIRAVAPSVPVILDAKYGDIGNTNNGYATYAFRELEADAVTIHDKMGHIAMKPFLNRADKGIFVLCRTSNEGAEEFQDLPVLTGDSVAPVPLYLHVASQVARYWNTNNNCGLVVGATEPDKLALVREAANQLPILIPGIGAQGGDLKNVVRNGRDARGKGIIVNSSRGIIFASNGDDFAEAARRECLKMHKEILSYL